MHRPCRWSRAWEGAMTARGVDGVPRDNRWLVRSCPLTTPSNFPSCSVCVGDRRRRGCGWQSSRSMRRRSSLRGRWRRGGGGRAGLSRRGGAFSRGRGTPGTSCGRDRRWGQTRAHRACRCAWRRGRRRFCASVVVEETEGEGDVVRAALQMGLTTWSQVSAYAVRARQFPTELHSRQRQRRAQSLFRARRLRVTSDFIQVNVHTQSHLGALNLPSNITPPPHQPALIPLHHPTQEITLDPYPSCRPLSDHP